MLSTLYYFVVKLNECRRRRCCANTIRAAEINAPSGILHKFIPYKSKESNRISDNLEIKRTNDKINQDFIMKMSF